MNRRTFLKTGFAAAIGLFIVKPNIKFPDTIEKEARALVEESVLRNGHLVARCDLEVWDSLHKSIANSPTATPEQRRESKIHNMAYVRFDEFSRKY
jgi:hypothetical protein